MTAAGPAIQLPAALHRRYDVVEQEVEIGVVRLRIAKPRDPEALIDEQDFARDERLPYWAEIWPSALALGDFLLRQHGNGRRTLELGCGTGTAGCCATRAGFDLTVSDYYPDALAFAAANIAADSGRVIPTCLFDWRAVEQDIGRFDVVVGADVLYERAYGALVARTIWRLLNPGGVAWIADPGRVGVDAFLEEALRLGTPATPVVTIPAAASGRTHQIAIYELTAPAER